MQLVLVDFGRRLLATLLGERQLIRDWGRHTIREAVSVGGLGGDRDGHVLIAHVHYGTSGQRLAVDLVHDSLDVGDGVCIGIIVHCRLLRGGDLVLLYGRGQQLDIHFRRGAEVRSGIIGLDDKLDIPSVLGGQLDALRVGDVLQRARGHRGSKIVGIVGDIHLVILGGTVIVAVDTGEVVEVGDVLTRFAEIESHPMRSRRGGRAVLGVPARRRVAVERPRRLCAGVLRRLGVHADLILRDIYAGGRCSGGIGHDPAGVVLAECLQRLLQRQPGGHAVEARGGGFVAFAVCRHGDGLVLGAVAEDGEVPGQLGARLDEDHGAWRDGHIVQLLDRRHGLVLRESISRGLRRRVDVVGAGAGLNLGFGVEHLKTAQTHRTAGGVDHQTDGIDVLGREAKVALLPDRRHSRQIRPCSIDSSLQGGAFDLLAGIAHVLGDLHCIHGDSAAQIDGVRRRIAHGLVGGELRTVGQLRGRYRGAVRGRGDGRALAQGKIGAVASGELFAQPLKSRGIRIGELAGIGRWDVQQILRVASRGLLVVLHDFGYGRRRLAGMVEPSGPVLGVDFGRIPVQLVGGAAADLGQHARHGAKRTVGGHLARLERHLVYAVVVCRLRAPLGLTGPAVLVAHPSGIVCGVGLNCLGLKPADHLIEHAIVVMLSACGVALGTVEPDLGDVAVLSQQLIELVEHVGAVIRGLVLERGQFAGSHLAGAVVVLHQRGDRALDACGVVAPDALLLHVGIGRRIVDADLQAVLLRRGDNLAEQVLLPRALGDGGVCPVVLGVVPRVVQLEAVMVLDRHHDHLEATVGEGLRPLVGVEAGRVDAGGILVTVTPLLVVVRVDAVMEESDLTPVDVVGLPFGRTQLGQLGLKRGLALGGLHVEGIRLLDARRVAADLRVDQLEFVGGEVRGGFGQADLAQRADEAAAERVGMHVVAEADLALDARIQVSQTGDVLGLGVAAIHAHDELRAGAGLIGHIRHRHDVLRTRGGRGLDLVVGPIIAGLGGGAEHELVRLVAQEQVAARAEQGLVVAGLRRGEAQLRDQRAGDGLVVTEGEVRGREIESGRAAGQRDGGVRDGRIGRARHQRAQHLLAARRGI